MYNPKFATTNLNNTVGTNNPNTQITIPRPVDEDIYEDVPIIDLDTADSGNGEGHYLLCPHKHQYRRDLFHAQKMRISGVDSYVRALNARAQCNKAQPPMIVAQSNDVPYWEHPCPMKNKGRKKRSNKHKEQKIASLEQKRDHIIDTIQHMRSHLSNSNSNPKTIQQAVQRLEKVKRQLQTEPRAHGLMDTLSDIKVPLVKNLYDLAEAIKVGAQFANIPEFTRLTWVRTIVALATTLYNVYNATSDRDVIVNLVNLFIQYFPHEYIETILTWFMQLIPSITTSVTEIMAQGDSDTYSVLSNVWKFFEEIFERADDMRTTQISDFILRMVTLWTTINKNLSTMDYESMNFDAIRKNFNIFLETRKETMDVFSVLQSALVFVSANWTKLISGDWSVVWLGKDQAKSFESEVLVLQQQHALYVANREDQMKLTFKRSFKQYEAALIRCIKEGEKLAGIATSIPQKLQIARFVQTLTNLQTAVLAMKAEAPTKPQAYAIKLCGPSASGKSTITEQIANIILNAYGHDTTDRGLISPVSFTERYESNAEPHHKVFIADDVGNNPKKPVDFDRVLNYVNTTLRPLEKAGVEEKGKKYPYNDGLIITTNVDDLGVPGNSACEASIYRRIRLHVDVNVRERYRNEYGGLMDLDEIRTDVHQISLKRFEKTEDDGRPIYEVISRDEWVLDDSEDQDLYWFCKFLERDVRKWRISAQKKYERMTSQDSNAMCHSCNLTKLVCRCDDEPIAHMSTNLFDNMNISLLAETNAMFTGFAWQQAQKIYFWKQLAQWLYTHRSCFSLVKASLYVSYGMALLYCLANNKIYPLAGLTSLTGLTGYTTYWSLKRQAQQALDRRANQLSSLCDDIYTVCEKHAKKAVIGLGATLLLISAIKIWYKTRINAEDTSSYLTKVQPTLKQVINEPSKRFTQPSSEETRRNYDYNYHRMPPEQTGAAKCTTALNLKQLVARRMRQVVVKTQGQQYQTVNGILVKGNVLLVPAHAIPDVYPFDIETTNAPGCATASTKDQKLDERHVQFIPHKDAALVHLPTSPRGENILKFFSNEHLECTRTTWLQYLSVEGDIIESKQTLTPYISDGKRQLQYTAGCEKKGILYGTNQSTKQIVTRYPLEGQLEFNSFGGLCGSLYLDANKAIIYGFHIAGYVAGSTQAWSNNLLRSELETALSALDESTPQMILHSRGEVSIDPYNTGRYSMSNAIPHSQREDGRGRDAIHTYYGEVTKDGMPMLENSRPPYHKTDFKGIPEEFGPCQHKPPTKPNDLAKGMKTLNKLTAPNQHYEADILGEAIEDYGSRLYGVMDENPEDVQEMFRCFTEQEALDGIGVFGLGGMPNDTSAGHPLNCSKNKILKKDPMDASKPLIPREFVEDCGVHEEISRVWNAWINGESSEAIFKASSKVNELLVKEKANEKVRKFFGSPVAFLVNARRVLPGLVMFLRKHWRESECMVGMNPGSREWQEFREFFAEYSTQHCFAGDFSGFDTTMSQQVSTGVAQIIINMFKRAGVMSDIEIEALKGCLTDICNPNVLFMGQLFNFANMNPSGQPITVQLNGMANSIMMRYVYYSIWRKNKGTFERKAPMFHTHVRLGTYGDDNRLSVKNLPWFNHTNCQKAFEQIGIGYTMADKGSKSVPYLPLEETDFLKRHDRFDEETGCWFAPVEKASIYKKFYWLKKPNETPLSPEEQFGAYVDSALLDMFYWGRPDYDDFIKSLRNIQSQNPTLRGVLDLPTYEVMWERIKHNFGSDYTGVDPTKLFEESGLLFL